MVTKVMAGKMVHFNAEGFMNDPNEWSKEVAVEIAKEEGIDILTDAHWKVIDFCRKDGLVTGKAPTLHTITVEGGISTKELFSLFPKGPAKKVARISGLDKPDGCI